MMSKHKLWPGGTLKEEPYEAGRHIDPGAPGRAGSGSDDKGTLCHASRIVLEYRCPLPGDAMMKYGMFIGEMLADRTRRATLKDLQPGTDLDLFANLREAMGEPSPDLSKKYVVL